jgi:hypothetical protein
LEFALGFALGLEFQLGCRASAGSNCVAAPEVQHRVGHVDVEAAVVKSFREHCA